MSIAIGSHVELTWLIPYTHSKNTQAINETIRSLAVRTLICGRYWKPGSLADRLAWRTVSMIGRLTCTWSCNQITSGLPRSSSNRAFESGLRNNSALVAQFIQDCVGAILATQHASHRVLVSSGCLTRWRHRYWISVCLQSIYFTEVRSSESPWTTQFAGAGSKIAKKQLAHVRRAAWIWIIEAVAIRSAHPQTMYFVWSRR